MTPSTRSRSPGFHCCRSDAIYVEVISASNSGLATSPRTALIWGSTVGNPVVTAPIVGASKISHLDYAIAATTTQLNDDETVALEQPYRPRPPRCQ
jgi:1-deoxyxylulose-5-phosphate synthase